MTKAEFTEWLQEQFEQAGAGLEFDAGDIYRDIDSGDLNLPDGVEMAMDHIGHDLIFRCSDGLLAASFETGLADETMIFYAEGQVEDNMREYTERELQGAVDCMSGALADLTDLKDLRG